MLAPLLCLALCGLTAPTFAAPTAASVPGWCSGIKNENMMSTMSTGCKNGNYRPKMASGAMPQASASPYTIQVDSRSGSTYTAGQNVSVIIKTTSARDRPFKAYFIRGDCSEATFAGDLYCMGGQETTFCYTNGSSSSDCSPKYRVECVWTPPSYSIGKVQFQATIIQDDRTYWTGVLSANVLDAAPSMISYEQNAKNLMAEQMKKFNAMKEKATQMMSSFKTGNVQQNMQQMMNMMKNMKQNQGGSTSNNNGMAAMQKMFKNFQNMAKQSQGGSASTNGLTAMQKMFQNMQNMNKNQQAQQQPSPSPQTAMQKMIAMMQQNQQQQQTSQTQNLRQQMAQRFGNFGQGQFGGNNRWNFGGNQEAAEAGENQGGFQWGK